MLTTNIETRFNSDEMLAKGSVGAVQEDPDDPDPSDFPAGTIQIQRSLRPCLRLVT